MHDFYPEYDERIEEMGPLTDLLAGLCLLQRPWNGGSRHWLISKGGFRVPSASPYILIEHFYNRSGEFAGAEMIRITPELAEKLKGYTAGLAYMGGHDENIRTLHGRGVEEISHLFEQKAAELRAHLKPGTGPDAHGWSSHYEYVGCARKPIKVVGTRSSLQQVEIPTGLIFRNPLNEEWVVQFDGQVLSHDAFKTRYAAERERLFHERKEERAATSGK